MRRLEELPQNLSLLVKQVFNKKTNAIIGVGLATFLLGCISKEIKIRIKVSMLVKSCIIKKPTEKLVTSQ